MLLAGVSGYSVPVRTSSFHTHTRLCKHAAGDPTDYVRQAVADGATALGFSDHCPWPDGTWAGSRMTADQIPLYFKQVRTAASEASFPVYCGFECEWDPARVAWIGDFLKEECGADYLVYGSHWIQDRGDLAYICDVNDHRALARYADLTVEGIASGLYDYIAHPDLFLSSFSLHDPDVRACARAIIDACAAMKLPMEINGLGMTRPAVRGEGIWRAPYPVQNFWEMAVQAGAVIICNSDAHRPQDVLAGTVRARTLAAQWGVPVTDSAVALGFAQPGS